MSGPEEQKPPRRRALPTVSDVVRELRGSTSVEPELLFKAARQVCAEELNRAKQGFEPAPMEILVKRARRMLGVAEDLPPTTRMENAVEIAAAGAPPSGPPAPQIAFVFDPEPEPPAPFRPPPTAAAQHPAPSAPPPPVPPSPGAPAPTPRFVLSTAEEPFLETTGSIDLKPIWAKKVSLLDEPLAPGAEPFAAAPPAAPLEGPTLALPLGGIDLLVPPPPAAPEPFPEPPPPPVPAALEPASPPAAPATAEPEPFEVGLAEARPKPASAGAAPPVLVPPMPTEPTSILFSEGPGDETLDQLKVEAASVKIEEVLPALESSGSRSVPEPPEPVPHRPEPAAAPVPEPGPVEEPRRTPSEPVRWRDVEPEASALFSPAKSEPARSRWPLVAALVIAAGAVAGWFYLRSLSRESTPSSPPVARTRPTPATPAPTVSTPPAAAPTAAPAAAAPTPSSASSASSARPTSAPTAVPPTPAPAAPTPAKRGDVPPPTVVRTQPAPSGPQSRAATINTADWAGREPIFAIHFSSYKERDKAEKDAVRLGKALDRPGHAVGIDLGEKGVWYRVMIGEFGSAEEALAFRSELEQKGTPNMGFVYRVVGKTP